MKGNIFRWVIGILALAGALAGAFFIGRGSVEGVEPGLLEELERLRAEQTEVAVTRRVSRQMEDIAYQQKLVSDMERERAEEQSRLAISLRDRAEQESRSARNSESRAILAAQESRAEREKAVALRKIAEEQRDEATRAKSVADTLAYRILGRTLGTTALAQYEGGNRNLASQLAYASWYFLKMYGGNTCQSETFDALSICSGSRSSMQTRKGGAVTDMCPVMNIGCIAVTDYGEVEMHSRTGSRRKVLYQNKKYNFSGVWADSCVIYALSRRGPLCRMDFRSAIEEIGIPEGTYLRLIRYSDGLFLLVEKNALYLLDVSSGAISAKVSLDGNVSAALAVGGRVYVFFDDGRSVTADSSLVVTPSGSYAPRAVTAACYDEGLCAFFLGCDDGNVLFLDRDMNILTTLYGHSGKVTDVQVAGSILVSGSYDRKLLIWNLPLIHLHDDKSLADVLGIPEDRLPRDAWLSSNEWLAPASVSCDAWPLSLCLVSDNEIVAGTAGGQVQMLNVSTDDMAAMIRSGMTPMTAVEWGRYVGAAVPYVNF